MIDKLEIFLNETNSTALQTYAKQDLLLYDDRVEDRNLSIIDFSNISQEIAVLLQDKNLLRNIKDNFISTAKIQSCKE